MRGHLLAILAVALSLQAQPRAQSFTLPNGLRVLHLEDHEHPLLRARLQLRIEPADTPPGRQGLPLLFLRMLERSDAGDLKAEELARLLEDSGIQLAHSLAPDALTWGLVARSRDQDRALGLLANRLLRTVFDPALLEAQRLASWHQEERLEKAPQAGLKQALEQDPAARPTRASLNAITMEDLLTFRAKVFRPDRAVLVLHGDLGLEQAKRLVLLNLGSWTVQDRPAHSESPSSGPAQTQPMASLARPPRLMAGGPGMRIQAVAPRPGDLTPETAGLLSLLMLNVPSLYPVQVTAEKHCLVATLDAEVSTSSAESWSLLHGRLEALRQRGFTQADLDHARTAMMARRSLDSLNPEAEMDAALAEGLGQGVSLDRMKALTLDALNAGLRSWLDPARLRSGAEGPADALISLPDRRIAE